MTQNTRRKPTAIDGLAILAGTIYGAFLGSALFGGSWLSLLIGAILGFFILPLIFLRLTLSTAGVFIGMSGIGSTWTEEHERRAQRIAKILLIILSVVGLFGLLFSPAS